MKERVGVVKEIWRYPVKSFSGEALDQAYIEQEGLMGDRWWAVRDNQQNETGNVRKFPKLLQLSAKYVSEPKRDQIEDQVPSVDICFPDQQQVNSRDSNCAEVISGFLGKDVSIWPLQSKEKRDFYKSRTVNSSAAIKKQFNSNEIPSFASFSWKKMMELSVFATPLGRFYDSYPLHVLTSASLNELRHIEPAGDFSVERFRPNIFIETLAKKGFEEFNWVGGKLFIGSDVVIKCESKTVRCLMPAQPQVNIKKDSLVLKTVQRFADRYTGINATVLKAGEIKSGDTVYWQPEPAYSLRRFIQPLSGYLKNGFTRLSLKCIDKFYKK